MRTDLKLLTIEDLCRELAVVRRDAGRSRREITAEIERRIESLRAENAALRGLLNDVASGGVEQDLRKYVVVQIAAETWREVRTHAAAKPAAQEGKEAADG